ncbi:MAG: hypothetical protein U5L45_05345 [Saprospiraceae bacterium]|nr:hypothetical protein [Saprospiraceae bacterium]
MKKYDILLSALVLLIICLTGVFDAVKDTLSHHYAQSVFKELNGKFWDASVSWCNKWKDCESGTERFPLSSSVLVFMTDGWHLMKFLINRLTMICPAFLLMATIEFDSKLLNNLLIKFLFFWILCLCIQASVFHLFYHYILIK